VEYDDVINRQRETIYAERDRILRRAQLSDTILAMVEDEVAALVAEHTVGEFPSEWNREGLIAQIGAMLPNIPPAELQPIEELNDPAEITQHLAEILEAQYEAKRAEVGEQGMAVLERLVLLRVIDTLWVDHLTAIDDMRRGIGLRAYSQRDPLNEFKIEAYRMFDELKSMIRRDVARTIFRVTLTRQPEQPQPMRNLIEGRVPAGAAAAGGGATTTAAVATAGNGNGSGSRTPARSGPKVGRNDPCWCGSGKKFKKCHGA
jgi:preprotein translocase subunit SecA